MNKLEFTGFDIKEFDLGDIEILKYKFSNDSPPRVLVTIRRVNLYTDFMQGSGIVALHHNQERYAVSPLICSNIVLEDSQAIGGEKLITFSAYSLNGLFTYNSESKDETQK